MSYLAIARKYRPATFAGIVGQEHVTRTLANAIARDRIHHAFLFCGARGVGKTTAARALAKSLNCEQGPTAEPCGVCISCMEIAAGTSPDLIEIDGASNNSVDDIRDLRETVRYAPQRGRRKIYLIDEVHMLSTAAFNALLKTLEEPPPHVVFLFATTEPHKIPDTILSRVQRFDFKRIPVASVVTPLREIATQEGASLTDAGLRMIARAGEGSMRDAQSLLDKVISVGGPEISDELVADTLGLIDRSLVHRFLEGMITGVPETCLDVIAEVHNYGHEMSVFADDLLETLRDATVLTLSPSARAHVDLAEEEIETLAAIAAKTDRETLARTFEAMLEVHEQVARASRPRIVLEMAVARLATTQALVPVGQLVARLEGLERRLRGDASRRGSSPAPTRRAGPGRANRAPSARDSQRSRSRRTRGATPALADTATDDERWAAFCAALTDLEPPCPHLTTGFPRTQGQRLVVTVDAGRPFAAASREVTDAGVLTELARIYGPQVQLRVEPSLASQRPELAADLEREVLQDSTMQRVLSILGGTLADVRPSSDEGETP